MEPTLKYSLLVAVGLVVLAVGLVMGWYGFPVIVDNMIDKEMVLTPSSKSFDPWQSPTSEVDVYMQFILFSVNNSQDVIAGGKPIVHELGPFSYKENRQRVNLSWSEDGTELTYNEVITYHFDNISSGEGLSEDTIIITINAPMVVVASMDDKLPASVRRILYNIINSEEEGHLFRMYKAGELLMTGVEDKLFTYVATYFPSLLPPTFADGKFRLYAYNNTVDGPYTILTGKTNMDEFTFIQSYQNKNHLIYWNDTYCDMLNGTDGITFPDNIGDVNRIYIFNKDMCRSIYLDYEKDVQYFGIAGRRFTPPRGLMENITVNPDNQCFCVPAGNCLDAGVMSLSPCQYGAPIVASAPHFYNGAQQYVDAVIGLSPDKNLHETFVDLEPVTGLTLNGGKKIQINLQLKRYPEVHGLENITEILFPIVYTNETAKIDQAGADDFNHQVGLPLKLLKAAQWVMIAGGGVTTVVALLLFCRSSSSVTSV